ncbi:MAG: HpsJ family protein [Prochlorococcaceae cyanobacterium]
MTDPTTDLAFSPGRARSFARLTAYTMLGLFVVSAIPALLPLAFAQPERLFGSLRELLERSTLPLVALILLFAGFGGAALPAGWEVRLATWLRPLLRLVALLYLITAVAIVAVADEIQSQGVAQLKGQLQTSLTALKGFRQQVQTAPDGPSLRRLLAQQPPLRPSLSDPSSPLASPVASVEQQRAAAAQLLDRVEANFKAEDLRRRSDAAGNLLKENLRLAATAAIYTIFYLLASLLWPARLGAWIERGRLLRAERAFAEAEADEAG